VNTPIFDALARERCEQTRRQLTRTSRGDLAVYVALGAVLLLACALLVGGAA
jgi:hypothetical protein